MPRDVLMPALGLAQETGKVLQWLKAEGEAVRQGEPLLEIETDKITLELEAPASGVLANVSAQTGEEVAVGSVIAEIWEPQELAQPGRPRLSTDQVSPAPKATPAQQQEPSRPAPPVAPAPGDESRPAPARPAASPKARRLAAERGIDLAAMQGKGPSGAVLATDLAAEKASGAALKAEALPLSTVWRLMAERTAQSWSTVPHFCLLRQVLASRLVAWRDRHGKASQQEITYTDLLAKLVASALGEHRQLNSEWQEGEIRLKPEINLGLTVATEQGLLVPVIHRADQLSVGQIAARRLDLVSRAQAGKLRPEDLRGGTFTISNLGMYGVDAFQAIVNSPQAAILAVGRIAPRVVAVDNQPAVEPAMILTLCCDHRIVDGARAAQFLDTLARRIEEPREWLE